MIRLEMNIESDQSQVGSAVNRAIPIFEYYHPLQGLCMPSTCSPTEIRSLVSKSLENFPLLSVQGNFKCDTKESVSYGTRFRQLTKSQWIAL